MAQDEGKLTEQQKKIRRKVLDQIEQQIMSLPKDAFPNKGGDEAMAVELGVGKIDKDKAKKLAKNKGKKSNNDDNGSFDEFLKKKKKQVKSSGKSSY